MNVSGVKTLFAKVLTPAEHCHSCLSLVDKLLSNEAGDGIFDDPPIITESVLRLQDHDDEDDFDALSRELQHLPFAVPKSDFTFSSCNM